MYFLIPVKNLLTVGLINKRTINIFLHSWSVIPPFNPCHGQYSVQGEEESHFNCHSSKTTHCLQQKSFAATAKNKSQKRTKCSAINHLIYFVSTDAIVVAVQQVCYSTKADSVINVIAYITFPDLLL